MKDAFRPFERLINQMLRRRQMIDSFGMRGFGGFEHWRDGKMLGVYNPFKNLITNVGKNKIFDVMFNSDTQIAQGSWYMGLISSVSYTAIAAADTSASHSGWTEFVGYSQSTRVLWGQTTSSGQTITNGTPATFDFNATGTVKGLFIISVATKSGTTGVLWNAALFDADVPVVSGDQLKNTYSVAA